jgi:transcriptional regulator with XRE-family HTH domain
MVRNENDALGEIIKSARVKMRLTQEQFAEMVEVSPRYITSIENENKRPAYNKLFLIIRTLGLNANDIFYPEMRTDDTSTQRLYRLLSQCKERDIKAITALVETLLSE